tara:strand:+ start:1049 stop:1228 length:180 start_codon:yes stop_codon:yes gene_type:complete
MNAAVNRKKLCNTEAGRSKPVELVRKAETCKLPFVACPAKLERDERPRRFEARITSKRG